MIKNIIWASMIDYPGHIATVLFFGGCNFDCSYCYNKELIKMETLDFYKKILPKLIERKPLISHVILSGGECTVSDDFEGILSSLYDEGFIVGIHTNGSTPNKIEKNVDKISYIGIDIKTVEEKYSQISGKLDVRFSEILHTIRIAKQNDKEFECRTTLFPKYVTIGDCVKISKMLRELEVKEYVIQQYYEVGSACRVSPYDEKYIRKIKEECNKIIPTKLKVK